MQRSLPKEEEKLEVIYESLKGETADLHKAMEAKQKQLLPYQKKILQAQSSIDLVVSQQAIIRKRCLPSLPNRQKCLCTVFLTLHQTRVENATHQLQEATDKLKEMDNSQAQSLESIRVSSATLKEAKKRYVETH